MGEREEREQMGWLASSAVPARKRRHIEGVSSTGVLELQAELYRTQDHARMRADGLVDPAEKHVHRRKADPFNRVNAGVAERSERDRMQLKGTAADPNREAEVAAALERKAQLYDKLARGEVDDEREAYEVDFFRKGHSLDDEGRMLSGGAAGGGGFGGGVGGGMQSRDMQRERERQEWEAAEEARLAAEGEASDRRAAHKQAIRDLTAETAEGRERAAALRQRREAQVAAKRERLKAAFLQKQLGKALAGKAGGGGGGGGGGGKGAAGNAAATAAAGKAGAGSSNEGWPLGPPAPCGRSS